MAETVSDQGRCLLYVFNMVGSVLLVISKHGGCRLETENKPNDVGKPRNRFRPKAKRKTSMQIYREYVRRYNTFRKYYHSQFNPELVKGRCKQTPIWQINGKYPVLDELDKGNAVFLFLIKRTCKKCWSELESLHIWAEYFKKIDQKAVIIALNHKKQPISEKARKHFRLIKIYDEPDDQDIFGMVKGSAHDILMYDKCGRQHYHYKYPYSTMMKPYVRLAMKNTIVHFKTFCGECKPIVIPTIMPLNSTKSSPTTTARAAEREERADTDGGYLRNIDGPNNDEYEEEG